MNLNQSSKKCLNVSLGGRKSKWSKWSKWHLVGEIINYSSHRRWLLLSLHEQKSRRLQTSPSLQMSICDKHFIIIRRPLKPVRF